MTGYLPPSGINECGDAQTLTDRGCRRRGAVVGKRVQFEVVGLGGAARGHDVDGGHPVDHRVPTSTRATATTTRPRRRAVCPHPRVTRIEVDSTPEQYFVLYLRPDLNAARDYPVAVTRGQAGKTTLTDGRTQLPTAHYRVATFVGRSAGRCRR